MTRTSQPRHLLLPERESLIEDFVQTSIYLPFLCVLSAVVALFFQYHLPTLESPNTCLRTSKRLDGTLLTDATTRDDDPMTIIRPYALGQALGYNEHVCTLSR